MVVESGPWIFAVDSVGDHVARCPAALLFDLDGTLVDSEDLHFRSTSAVLAARGIQLEAEDFAIYEGWDERACWLHLIDRFALQGDPLVLMQQRTDAFLALLRHERMVPRPGVQAVLTWGTLRSLPLAVVSSLPLSQIDALLSSTGIARFFQSRVSGYDDVAPGRGKPCPDVYLKATSRLGVDIARCLIFEDSCVGMQSGRRAGGIVIGVKDAPTGASPMAYADVSCSSMIEAANFCRGHFQ